MNKLISKIYFLSVIIPSITLFLTGLISKSKDCNECFILIFVGSTLALLSLMLLNLVLFINKIKIENVNLSFLVNKLSFAFTPITSTIFVFHNYFDINQKINSDFKIILPSLLMNYITSYILYKKFNRQRNQVDA